MKRNFTVPSVGLDGIEVFLAVARRESFRRAAADLGISPSAVSQAVRAFEKRIGALLFTRTTRSVGLTEAGARLLEKARSAWGELEQAVAEVRDLGARPSGRLRLAVPRSAVPVVLQPLIASFCAAYPEIELEIAASEELVDLAREGFDAGLRMGQFIDANMVAVRLSAPFRFAVVATPAHLARAAALRRPADLNAHACLRQRRSGGAIAPWRFQEKGRPLEIVVRGPLIANDFATLLGAALEGVGFAQVPHPIAANALADGKLIEVLERFAPMTPGVFLYYASRRQVPPKLRAFIEHAKASSARRRSSVLAAPD